MNVAVSKISDDLFIKGKEYNIVSLEGQVVRIECEEQGKTLLVGLDDTDFTFIFNKNDDIIALPCSIGDTVYKVYYQHCCTCTDWDYYAVTEKKFELEMVKEWGNSIFGTKEEAETEAKRRNEKAKEPMPKEEADFWRKLDEFSMKNAKEARERMLKEKGESI